MLRAGDGIVLCVFGLLSIGVVMVNSAGLTINPQEAVTFQSIMLSRATVYMALSVAAMFLVARLPVGEWLNRDPVRRLMPWVLPVLVGVLLLAYIPGLGHEVNGANRWIKMPGIGMTMQPSEIAKWGMVLLLAWWCVSRGRAMASFWRGLVPALAAIGIVAALVAHQDLGTAVLIGLAGCVVLVAGGARIWQLACFIPAGLGAFALGVWLEPYRMLRLRTFMNPYEDPEGAGYHMIQSLVAVANGEGWGRGLGFGLQKFGYLPEDRTDFLFAVICEELGLAGAGLAIALYIAIFWFAAAIIRRETSLLLRLVGVGVCSTFGLQALINLAVVTGLAPTKGIALPLLSYGGTGWMFTAASLGVLVAMDRASERREAASGLLDGSASDAGARRLAA